MTTPHPAPHLAPAERDALQHSLARLDRLAHLMDEQFRLPIVGWRVGLDPIIGLIPGGGDWAAWVPGVYIFWEALRLGAPRRMLARMVFNLTVDLVVGYIPGPGDLFDAAFKANRKNVDMLLAHYNARRVDTRLALPAELPAPDAPKSRLLRYAAGALAVIFLFLIAALPFLLLWWWFNAR